MYWTVFQGAVTDQINKGLKVRSSWLEKAAPRRGTSKCPWFLWRAQRRSVWLGSSWNRRCRRGNDTQCYCIIVPWRSAECATVSLSRWAHFGLHFNEAIPCVLSEMDFSINRNEVTR